jgi:NTE family protein
MNFDVNSPRFALVLGSGGVRSIAALGMVEVLWREGLRPDLIVGCSAGAMFGALMACGHNAQEAVHIATTLWSPEVTRQRRWLAVVQMLMPRLGRFDEDFALRDDRLLLQRLDQAFGDAQLEDLRLPLRVTATGDTVVIRQGSVVDALRATIALPFMFKPMKLNGMRLMDGFTSDPLPVSAAADARCVLALGFASPMPRRIDLPTRLLAQVTSTMTNNLMQARLEAAQATGMRVISVFPKLERRVGLFDTDAMPYLVEAGRRATEEKLPQIMAMLDQVPHLMAA